ncbi:glycosyltransferase family 29 protein [bacterium]|nr:glycosyltransferase family 29 protein [bacterium]
MLKKKVKLFNPNLYISENIAIVGSSSSLLKKKNGRYIDTFCDVVRFNNAHVENFEEFVGSKTTLRIVNNPTFECLPMFNYNEKDQFFVKYLYNMNIAIISPHKINDRSKLDICNASNNYFFLENKYFQYIVILYFANKINIFKDLLKIVLDKKNFSIGFYTIILCIISRIKPVLFGFDLDEDMNFRSHYWEKIENPAGRHNLNLEHQILKMLVKYDYIELG